MQGTLYIPHVLNFRSSLTSGRRKLEIFTGKRPTNIVSGQLPNATPSQLVSCEGKFLACFRQLRMDLDLRYWEYTVSHVSLVRST